MPDIGGFAPIMAEDARIVSLLSEADGLSDTDPDAASHDLLDVALPRAQRNADAAERVVVEQPIARELQREMVQLTRERAVTTEAYGRALGSRDTAAQLAVVHRQRALENAMNHFEQELADARARPPERACSVSASTPTR